MSANIAEQWLAFIGRSNLYSRLKQEVERYNFRVEEVYNISFHNNRCFVDVQRIDLSKCPSHTRATVEFDAPSPNRGMIQFDWHTWEALGRPDWRDVHRLMLLPDAYRVTGVKEEKLNTANPVVTVYVESPLIPDGYLIAQLKPVYRQFVQEKEQQTIFDHMELHSEQGWEWLSQQEEQLNG
jgi:hypothetical protein